MTHTSVGSGTGTHTLKVDALARVEGEGAMRVEVRSGTVTDVQLKIFEPPRFFEAFLRGRRYTEPPDITARICGICPVAYQMSSCQAIEDACGVVVDGPIRDLRRLLYCGEWIESHALHVYLLHAPDFLGYEDAISLAADHREVVERGLRLKKVGNDLLDLIGGRAVHPINIRLGGFYRVPTKAELAPIAERLKGALEDALATVRLVATFSFPDFTQDYELVALSRPDEYAVLDGRFVSSRGLDFPVRDVERFIVEEHVAHSNALHARLGGRDPYFVGPLARYTLGFDRLHPVARDAAAAAGLGRSCYNPFHSIIVRSVEIVQACAEALRLIDGYEPPDRPYVEVPQRAGTGYGASEAPRGVLWHRYTLDAAGTIRDARIVPPTSQNQPSIEDDLRAFVQDRIDLPHDELTRQCETAIRNYDPCISCATHFLDLTVDRQ